MKLTKYGHSLLILELESKKLIIDPGVLSALPENIKNSVALVITHSHPDHYNPESVDHIRSKNPDIKIFVPADLSNEINGSIVPNGKKINIGPFEISFNDEMHEFIRTDFSLPLNLSISINNLMDYPGDSYPTLKTQNKYLMVPIAGPWARMKETEAFIVNSGAELIIPTHDAVLSSSGKSIYDAHLDAICKNNSKTYKRIPTGESLNLI